ncbi:uncharacterized protein AAES06_020408 [Glossophaga mutica]
MKTWAPLPSSPELREHTEHQAPLKASSSLNHSFLQGCWGPAVMSETQGTPSIGSLDNQDDHELYSSRLGPEGTPVQQGTHQDGGGEGQQGACAIRTMLQHNCHTVESPERNKEELVSESVIKDLGFKDLSPDGTLCRTQSSALPATAKER